MKLWKKISLICIAVLTIIVGLCSAILLTHSKNSILSMAHSQAEAKQRDLAMSFSTMANYYITDGDSETAKNTLIDYCFMQFADTSSVLMKGEKTIEANVEINPALYLPLTDRWADAQIYEGEIVGRNILIVGSVVDLDGEAYAVYIVEDISGIYNSIVDILWTFALVSCFGVAIGAALIMLLTRRSTKPLMALAGVARHIAGGKYDMRASTRTNDEVGTLAADFNTMAAAVEERVADLTETAERQRLFIGGVTHEFKTPLTSLLLHARMLRRANMTDAEKDNSLEHIETQCEWLERLTQALLKLITLGQDIELKETTINELFESVRQSTQETLSNRGVLLETSCDADTLPLNADLMQALLVNLVDNASKAYDEDDEQPIVHLSVYDNVLEVQDYGRGIPQDALQRIYEPFFMVDTSRSKKNGGSGLGLALVKKIADAHGASITVVSELGKGTTVRVLLSR